MGLLYDSEKTWDMRTFFDRCRVHLTVSALQRGFRELICVFVASMGHSRAALEARSNNGPMHLHERLLEEWRPVLLGLSEPMISGRGKKPQCRAGRPQKSNRDQPHATRAYIEHNTYPSDYAGCWH